MKVLVQDRQSRFLGGGGKWHADHAKAQDHEGVLRALEAVWDAGLDQARILLKRDDGETSVWMDVDGARA